MPWGIWKITRWTFLRCHYCGTQLDRAFDLQFWMLAIFGIAEVFVVLALATVSPYWFYLMVPALIMNWLIDVATIRLRQRRGRGFDVLPVSGSDESSKATTTHE